MNLKLLGFLLLSIPLFAQTTDSLVPSDSSSQTLREVLVQGSGEGFAAAHLRQVEDFGIYAGKKTEVVELDKIAANTSTNNPRQVFGRVTGLNIWESDGAGLQLGIGGRGLNPNRTANFNTRQNGYDISADALGYPESYYTPPIEALDRIEIVRGAASLQYGTQFGGLLNFRFKQPSDAQKFGVTARQTVGSWGYFGSFNSVSGHLDKQRISYYACFQYKRGDGWRPNSGFDYRFAYADVHWQATKRLMLELELTRMDYEAQQPGGLTDKLFETDARQSVRARNWFGVQWNLGAVQLNYAFSEKTRLNVRTFGLLATRQSLGNLERINVVDFGGNRTMIDGQFKNVGQETRIVHQYTRRSLPQTLLFGYRLYRGNTGAAQGDASDGSGPDFAFLHPDDLENSDYVFPSQNQALFAEHLFQLSSKWSLTPGLRLERIVTEATGYYKQRVLDAAGNVVVENRIDESRGRQRAFLIGGVGAAWKPREGVEWYANATQNYRAINFSDLRIDNPNIVVDTNIQDERGFSADLGLKFNKNGFFVAEVTAFYIAYNGRIGQVLRADRPPLFNDYRFRSNIADARNIGIEAFAEFDVLRVVFGRHQTLWRWTVFVNAAVVDARYIHTDDTSIDGKYVEMAPPLLLRSGSGLQWRSWRASFQYAYTSKQYSDASNAERTASAVEGVIPAYGVADLSLKWRYKWLIAEASCNNLFDARYFTRRADSYPGPGIIPAEGRGFFVTLGFEL